MTPIRCGAPLSADAWRELRTAAIFGCHKWDPQVGDVATLARAPLLLDPSAWTEIARLAEALAAETIAAEAELAGRPDLVAKLALPRGLRRAVLAARPPRPGDIRVMRFDFHPTGDGWAVSEVNGDVPGGYNEAGGVSALYLPHVPGARLAGDPGATLARCLADRRAVALVHATAYTDDRQVMVYLADRLAEVGVQGVLVAPDGVTWRDGGAEARGLPVDHLFRFFPAEWLPGLPGDWRPFFTAALPATNHPRALLSQDKRFPLTWDHLTTPLPTWRALLPETRHPRDVAWVGDPGWVIKPALGRVGEDIGMVGVTAPTELRRLRWAVALSPGSWVAQRRFTSAPVDGPDGPRHACLGVYTVDGRAAGVYGRVGVSPLIDGHAVDTPVLLSEPA